MSKGKSKNPFFAWFAFITLCLVALVFNRIHSPLQFQAGLVDALEIQSDSHKAALQLVQGFQNKVMVLVGHKQKATALEDILRVKSSVQTLDSVQSVNNFPITEAVMEQIIAYYGSYPFAYLSNSHKETLKQQDSNEVAKGYYALLSDWANPIVSKTIEFDPTLSVATFLKEQFENTHNWVFDGQYLYIQDNEITYFPLFISLEESALDLNSFKSFYTKLMQVEDGLNTDSVWLMSGVAIHTAAAAAAAELEIAVLGTLSALGVIVLIAFVFKGVKPLLGLLCVLFSAVVTGLMTLELVFDSVHLLAFVFSISIVGVAIDYGFHALVMRNKGEQPSKVRKRLWLPLALALLSTLLGYSVFLFSPIGFLHQVVVFICTGLIGAYVAAILLIPEMKIPKADISLRVRLKRKLGYLIAATILMAICLPQISFDDSIASLNAKQPKLITYEKELARINDTSLYPTLVLVSGPSHEVLLQRASSIKAKLANVSKDAQTIRSITDWYLDSGSLNQNKALFKQAWQGGVYNQVAEYINSEQVIAHLDTSIEQHEPPAFIAEQFGLKIVQYGAHYYTPIVLSKPLNTLQIEALDAVDFALPLQIAQTLSDKLKEFRQHLLWFTGPVLLVICFVLFCFYGLQGAITMTAVSLVSAGMALYLSQLALGSLSIFNVLACMLIITLTLDYCIFFASHPTSSKVSATVGLSALSSVFAFGLMTFSTTPAVFGFGLTLLIGIIIGWLLSHVTPFHVQKHFTEKHNDSTI